MRNLLKIFAFCLLAQTAQAQCDTTGILLELQATTDLQGIIFANDRCLTTLTVLAPLYVNGDTLSIDTTGFGGGGSTIGLDTLIAIPPAAGFTIAGSPAQNSRDTLTFSLANDLAALEALASTGILARTASETYALRTITAGTGAITVTNGDGVSGNPTINNTDPDQSTTNEIQTYGHAGTTSYTNTLDLGGGSFTLQAAGILAISHTAGTVTMTATEVDGSTSNELQTIANTSNATSHTATLSNTGGSVQLVEGTGITLTTTGTSADGIVTIAATGTGDLLQNGNSFGANLIAGTNDNFTTSLETNGVTRLTLSSGATTGGAMTLADVTANTSTVEDALTIQVSSTPAGTASGFGGAILFQGETSTDGTMRDLVRLSAILTTATDASRASALVYADVSATVGPTERFRFTPTQMLTATGYTLGASSNTITLGGSSGIAVVSSTSASPAAVQINTSQNTVGGTTFGGSNSYTGTTLNKQKVKIGTDTYTVASGSGSLTSILINDTYDITGTASGVQKGIDINPTLTNLTATTYRAVDIQANHANAKGIYQSGASTINNLVGKTNIGSTTAPTRQLDVTGEVRITDLVTDPSTKVVGADADGDLNGMSVADLYTFLGMTGVANRFALWTGVNTLSSDAAFTFDAANDRMTVNGTVAGLGANNAFLNLNSGAISGATEFLRMSGNITGNLIAGMYNANTLAGSNTLFTISQAGNSAADPVLQVQISGTGGNIAAIGLDNSDVNKFKITPNNATVGGTANTSLVATMDAVPLWGINTDAPGRELDVSGTARSKVFVNTDAPPTWSLLDTGLGTGGVVNSTTGGTNGFRVNFTTGTGPAADGVLFRLTFANPFTITSNSVVFCKSITALNECSKFAINGTSPGFITLKANGTLTASTTYELVIITFGQ